MKKKHQTRQIVRKALAIISALLLPITFMYFSPWLPIYGASQGIINGSLLVFALLFFVALLFGRAWCAWGCPAGGLAEIGMSISSKPARGGKLDWIKWGIWGVWLGTIAWFAVSTGGYHAVDPFLGTTNGISLHLMPLSYTIYYTIVGIFFLLPFILGRRASCHYLCWIAPFMILGRTLRNLFRWPALRLKVEPNTCIDCKRCTRECQMSLNVAHMVQAGTLEHRECVLCGLCVDNCPKNTIRYSFSSGSQ